MQFSHHSLTVTCKTSCPLWVHKQSRLLYEKTVLTTSIKVPRVIRCKFPILDVTVKNVSMMAWANLIEDKKIVSDSFEDEKSLGQVSFCLWMMLTASSLAWDKGQENYLRLESVGDSTSFTPFPIVTWHEWHEKETTCIIMSLWYCYCVLGYISYPLQI